ncbi:MAG: 4-vinyl reductase [Bacteroidia bacterium]|nr:4-vinyl reductase [Bacteroidia bacterium]
MNEQHKHPFTAAYDKEYHAYWVGNEPMIFHCHHYNLFLQNSIKDAGEFFDTDTLLTQAAEYVAYHQFLELFGPKNEKNASLSTLLDAFSLFGFGKLNVEIINTEGGKVSTDKEHYSVGYISKYPIPSLDKEGVCYFAKGFIAAVFSYLNKQPIFSYEVKQTQCLSKGHDKNVFEVTRLSQPAKPICSYYAGKGVLGSGYAYHNHPDSPVDYLAILEALTQMVLVGDTETGLIDAFGVLLTRHYANYYCNISFGLLENMHKELGEQGIELVRDLLIEAGHICAFNTMGGIMTSMEWEALIKPMLKTREDWIHGIIACINALGWGTYIIRELIPYKSLTIELFNDYEANHFLARKYDFSTPISYLATGIAAGIMNLLYNADITQKPVLNEEFYNKAFKSGKRFIGKQIACRTMGAKSAIITATVENA